MAPKQWDCLAPGCNFKTDVLEGDVAIEYLKLHASQVHRVCSKPEKPKKPVLEMVGNTIPALDWDSFIHRFELYKRLAGIKGDAGNHFLDCLSKEVYSILFSTYGQSVSNQQESLLRDNVKKLVVRKTNKLLVIMELLALRQDSDERILNFISRVKAKARQCDLSVNCECGKTVDFKDNLILYMLVLGVGDQEIQEYLLTKEGLTLDEAEKKAIDKESAKFSQSGLVGESVQGLKSSYMKNKASFGKEEPKMCNYCGLPEHKSREKECKAFSQTCNRCGKIGHFKRVCKSKNKAGDKRDQNSTVDKDKEDTAAILGEGLFSIRGEDVISTLSS